MGQKHASTREEVSELLGFGPYRVHLFFVGIYRDNLHNNNGENLDRGALKKDVWHDCWT